MNSNRHPNPVKLVSLSEMKVIVFDTETSGLPTAETKPTIVQFSYVVYDVVNNTIDKSVNEIIKQPKGYIIPQEAINIHKITNEMCEEKGVDLKPVLEEFMLDSRSCDVVVGHNISFDINMIKWSLERLKEEETEPSHIAKYNRMALFLTNSLIPKKHCTMLSNIKRCGIQKINARGNTYLKFPKLCELHYALFKTVPDGLHDALVDVFACLRCYFKVIYNDDLAIINKDVKNVYNL
jgi:DNA polymerase III subunit epsilon